MHGSRSFICRTISLAAAVVLIEWVPMAHGQPPPDGFTDQGVAQTTALQERLEDLERKNEALELENGALLDQLFEASGWERPEPIYIDEISEYDDAYSFLSLGTEKDYLKAERQRSPGSLLPDLRSLFGSGGSPAADSMPISAPHPEMATEMAEPSLTPSEAVGRRIRQLERENRELEFENRELKKRISESAETEPPALPTEGAELAFLALGSEKDYLKAERYRIRDQIRAVIPPLYEPVRPFHAYTLPPGAWRVTLKNRSFWNNSDFGRDDHYAKLFEDIDVRSHRQHLSVLHGFEIAGISDMTLALDVPYRQVDVSGTGRPFRNDVAEVTMDGDGGGLGDISLTLKKKWLDQGNFPFNFATFTGVIFPTGKDDVELDRDQTLTVMGMQMPDPPLNLFGRNPNDRLLPPGLQPGQGAWGFRIGAAVTRQFTRSALHAGVIADIFAKNDGIVPGNEVKYGVAYVFPPLKSDNWALDLSIFGRYKSDSEFPGVGILGPREDFKYGNVVFFSPSVIYTPSPQTRFHVSPEFRIYEPNKGPSPEFGITIGFSYTW